MFSAVQGSISQAIITTSRSYFANAAENLISGFRKAGVYPLDRGQVLTRLPHKRDDLGLISSSFLDKLSDHRTDTAKEPRRKRRRLNVTPDMSVTAMFRRRRKIDCAENTLNEVIKDQEETNLRNEEIWSQILN